MLIYAGIDEAGYGPLIGPMCIAVTVWGVEQSNTPPVDAAGIPAPDLWKLLTRAVCRQGRDKRNRIAIADSKKLKGSNSGPHHPLTHLERSVLACLRCASGGGTPASDTELFRLLGCEPPAGRAWYEGSAAVPCCHDESSVRVASNLLSQSMRTRSITLRSIKCVALDADSINEVATRTGNKSAVNGAVVWELLHQIVATQAAPLIRIALDRQGGRIRYREDLQRVFPEWSMRVLQEDEQCSRYLLRTADHSVDISYQSRGETAHLPIALASMTAKYVRELWMARMNRFFKEHIPSLKPTAGYVQDGRRYLGDISELLTKMELPMDTLVRRV